jgi:hypothetical protein
MKLRARYDWQLQDWVWFPYRPEQLVLHYKLYPEKAFKQAVKDQLQSKGGKDA